MKKQKDIQDIQKEGKLQIK